MVAERSAAPPVARRRTKRNLRPLIIAATVAAVGGLGWWGWTKAHPADDGSSKLLTETVKRGDLIESISATGSVTAQTGAQVKIGSQITGVIKRLYADVGTKVKAGDTIAVLDLPDIEAQLNQAQANLAAARTKLLQQQSGVGMQHIQTVSGVGEAQASLNSAKARLQSAIAAANLQTTQTPNDIRRAASAVSVAQAALNTANSNLKQVKASVDLQVSNAQEQLNQAKATAANTSSNLKRQQTLLDKGFVAASVVDAAQAQDSVAQSQIQGAMQNIDLVKAKNAADLQAAQDAVAQAQQNVESAKAALQTAQAGTLTDKARLADVDNARAQVRQAEAALRLAQGNTTQDVLKQQDVIQAQEAVRQAQAQVDYNRAQLNKTIIKSPISGTVLQLASQQGETLAAGLSAPTLIIVADLTRLQVDAFVDETDIGKVRKNQVADITVDAFPKRVFKGHITKVASGSTIQQGVITYDVTIALDGIKRQAPLAGAGPAGSAPGGGGKRRGGKGGAPGGLSAHGGARAPGEPSDNNIMGSLKPDMTASVTIQTGKREGVLLVPSEAVKVSKRGTTVNKLVMKDGKKVAQPVPVKTGGSDGSFTEIRDGLKEDDTIVLAGMDDGRKGFGPSSPFGPAGGKGGGGKGGGGKGK